MPLAECRIADIGDVPFRSRYSLAESHEDIEAFFNPIAEAGCRPVSVGGDHSMTLPILKALGRQRPVGMIHIDAHCDTSAPMRARGSTRRPLPSGRAGGVLDPSG